MTAQPDGYDESNIYTTIIVDEALRRGVDVEILDPTTGEMRLRLGDRTLDVVQSLSPLTSAIAFVRCDDKAATRRMLVRAGLPVPDGRVASGGAEDEEFLRRHGDIVVKPARGEGGHGITVGVRTTDELADACERARASWPVVLLEERVDGDDVRVLVIDGEVVAASVRRPPTVLGDGEHTVQELIERRNETRNPNLCVPLDAITASAVRAAGYEMDEVLAADREIVVRATANLHTGGTIHDVTDSLHPDHAGVALQVAAVLDLPVAGVDLMVERIDGPGQYVIEVNEEPGLANHEPQPTAARYLDLLFPETADGRGA